MTLSELIAYQDSVRTRWTSARFRIAVLGALIVAFIAHVVLVYAPAVLELFGIHLNGASSATTWVSFATIALLGLPELITIVPLRFAAKGFELSAPADDELDPLQRSAAEAGRDGPRYDQRSGEEQGEALTPE